MIIGGALGRGSPGPPRGADRPIRQEKHDVPLHEKHVVLYGGMEPQSQLYTRAQIAALTSIDASTLNYWSRENLLVPAEGGGGKGSHRRFDYVQVNIAAIFGALRRFGLNIGALRTLADLLQEAARLGASIQLHPTSYSDAALLSSRLHLFRTGGEVLINEHALGARPPENLRPREYSDWLGAKRPAVNEAEIVLHVLRAGNDHDSRERIAEAAEVVGPGRDTFARLYADLVMEIDAPGYSAGYSWLLAINEDGTWRVAFGDGAKFFDTIASQEPEDFGTGFFVPVSGIIRKVWGLKTYQEHRRDRQERYIAGKLTGAGIDGRVIVHDDESFEIEAPGVTYEDLEAALHGTIYALDREA